MDYLHASRKRLPSDFDFESSNYFRIRDTDLVENSLGTWNGMWTLAMQKGREILVDKTQMAVAGRFFKTARLRHEWFEFLEDPPAMVKRLQQGRPIADVFTFLQEIHNGHSEFEFRKEVASCSVVKITPFEEWWKHLDFKVRNKIRKAQKCGVELRPVQLDDTFVAGVESIYNESPVRQGRKFPHYGKSLAVIKEDLSSFPECTFFIGAYHGGELIGFMKLFQGNNILRTVHIIAKLSQRDKPVMDALIAKAVELCNERKIGYLHYGDWDHRGLGTFRKKHGFERHNCPRYFVPVTWRGKLMLKLNLHHPVRDYVPQVWLDRIITLRNKLNAISWGTAKQTT